MTTPVLKTRGFAAAVIDALAPHICVLDKLGVIVAVNRAWQNFATENPPVSNRTGVGAHYLEVCRSASGGGSEGAAKFASGVQAVLDGKIQSFQMEYPCHSPTQNRWFIGEVSLLEYKHGGAVISHMSITDRKLLEFELMRSATTDALTGLPNRRYFHERGDLEIERVRRFGATASVMMVDIDHFKAVNDRYGHAVGDETLRCFARVCKKMLRKIDLFARIGGEEFAIVLPGTNVAGALNIAEKLRQAVAKTPIEHIKGHFNTTASFGVTGVRSSDNSVSDCLGRADRALYAAKRAGRNRAMNFSAIPQAAQKTLV